MTEPLKGNGADRGERRGVEGNSFGYMHGQIARDEINLAMVGISGAPAGDTVARSKLMYA